MTATELNANSVVIASARPFARIFLFSSAEVVVGLDPVVIVILVAATAGVSTNDAVSCLNSEVYSNLLNLAPVHLNVRCWRPPPLK